MRSNVSNLAWVAGTALVVTWWNNINSSTNGLVNCTLSNTQSGATVMQKIDSGSSAQAHINYLAVWSNASTWANAFEARMGTWYTGDLFHWSLNSVDKFRVDYNGAITCASSVTTGAPSGGTAGAWKTGILVTAAVVPDTTRYIQLNVGGTLYKVIIST